MRLRIRITEYLIAAAIILFCLSPAYSYSDEEAFKLIRAWRISEVSEHIEAASPEIRGVYNFYRGDYREAARLLEGTGGYFEELANLTTRITSDFNEIKSRYFLIRFTDADAIPARLLKSILDAAAEELKDVFGWIPTERAVFEIYPDRVSFQAASTLTDEHIRVSGAVGICKFNRMMILSPRALMFGYIWPDTAVHEYVHYLLGRIASPENIPLWLNEGLAKRFERVPFAESRLSPVEENYLLRGVENSGWVELEKMRYGMPNLESRDEVVMAFAQVHSMVIFMEEVYGRESFRDIIRLLKTNEPEEALESVYAADTFGLLSQWEEWLHDQSLTYTPGASAPSFAFRDDPSSAVDEWVREIAASDMRIASMFERRGNLEAAERKYIDALGKNPGSSVILTHLGRVRERLGRETLAEEVFLKAINNNRSYPPPYIRLASILYNRGEYERSASLIKEYIYRVPNNPEAWRILISSKESTGDTEGALRATELMKLIE